ncbi:MAG TPA: hypothetical protein ENL06_03775, partial [Candidatus Portnoybacteria bacterium]|nr:hypothetical protein [Candidatus Portnoybacteria bacterium]
MRKLEGLSFDQVTRRQKKYGLNEVSFCSTFSELKIFLRQFKNILILILLSASIITGYLGDFVDTAVILFSVLVMVFIGYSQERRVNKILEILKKNLKNTAIVVRDGVKKEIDAKEVTIDDLVILSRGNRVPADGTLIKSNNLTVNESILTGEWEPVDKKNKNIVYAGSLIENGWGKMVVSAIGKNTKMGKIYARLADNKEQSTPYQEKINAFGKIIGGVILLLCFYLFVMGVISGRDPLEMFTLAVAVGVGAIPEGLPIAITVALVLGARRILNNNGLIKR